MRAIQSKLSIVLYNQNLLPNTSTSINAFALLHVGTYFWYLILT